MISGRKGRSEMCTEDLVSLLRDKWSFLILMIDYRKMNLNNDRQDTCNEEEIKGACVGIGMKCKKTPKFLDWLEFFLIRVRLEVATIQTGDAKVELDNKVTVGVALGVEGVEWSMSWRCGGVILKVLVMVFAMWVLKESFFIESYTEPFNIVFNFYVAISKVKSDIIFCCYSWRCRLRFCSRWKRDDVPDSTWEECCERSEPLWWEGFYRSLKDFVDSWNSAAFLVWRGAMLSQRHLRYRTTGPGTLFFLSVDNQLFKMIECVDCTGVGTEYVLF